jgi:hypothetical protein
MFRDHGTTTNRKRRLGRTKTVIISDFAENTPSATVENRTPG